MTANPVEMAFALAKTGKFKNFTAVKKALKRDFNVERELQGRQLAADVSRLCKESEARLAAEQAGG